MRYLVLVRDGDTLLNVAIRPGHGVTLSLGAEVLDWVVDDTWEGDEGVELVWTPEGVN